MNMVDTGYTRAVSELKVTRGSDLLIPFYFTYSFKTGLSIIKKMLIFRTAEVKREGFPHGVNVVSSITEVELEL